MIVIALDHPAKCHVVLVKGGRVGWTPPVRHVGHDEHAELVGPVQLARNFDLDVLAQPIEADLPCAEDLVAQHAVGGEGVVPTRVIRLIERQLEKDGRAIERHVRIARAGQIDNADGAHPEVRLHPIGRDTGSFDGRHHFVQKRIVERPAPRVRQEHVDVDARRAARNPLADCRLILTIGEREAERQLARRRLQ